jgi:serine phosphatase RsbU (regulator of sigma subunit)
MDRELANMQRLGKRLNEYFAQVDEEMRLAGRLQRDFLPQHLGPIGPVTFAALYRPASWVSGDLYDIVRVDESHVAFYVVDAIGHGMAAALLTMFIKRAVTTKRIRPDGYELLEPSETLALLNDALAGQTLPRCQFVTGCYCLLNLETLVLRFARAGHPHPLLVDEDGGVTELHTQGGLLGVFRGEDFPTRQVQLRPGEKVILYTDGLELAYAPERYHSDPVAYYRAIFDGAAAAPAAELIRKLNADINEEAGSLHPRDDVTVVAMEVHAPTAPPPCSARNYGT